MYTLRGQPILGKEENQRQFYDDSTGICTMELTRRVLVVPCGRCCVMGPVGSR